MGFWNNLKKKGVFADLDNLVTNKDWPTGQVAKGISDSAARLKENPYSLVNWLDLGGRSLGTAVGIGVVTPPAAIYYGAKHGVKKGIDFAYDHPFLSAFILPLPLAAGIVVGVASTAVVATAGAVAVAGLATTVGVSAVAASSIAVVGGAKSAYDYCFSGKSTAEDNSDKIKSARKRSKENKVDVAKGVVAEDKEQQEGPRNKPSFEEKYGYSNQKNGHTSRGR